MQRNFGRVVIVIVMVALIAGCQTTDSNSRRNEFAFLTNAQFANRKTIVEDYTSEEQVIGAGLHYRYCVDKDRIWQLGGILTIEDGEGYTSSELGSATTGRTTFGIAPSLTFNLPADERYSPYAQACIGFCTMESDITVKLPSVTLLDESKDATGFFYSLGIGMRFYINRNAAVLVGLDWQQAFMDEEIDRVDGYGLDIGLSVIW